MMIHDRLHNIKIANGTMDMFAVSKFPALDLFLSVCQIVWPAPHCMALPADVLPKVLALVPADLRLTSSLRVASRSAKERVEARWWTAQVQRVKAFVDRHANVFADDPEIDEENADVTIEEQQEAFARNILLWVKPLLKNQPWRLEGPAADVTGEVTLQAAYINLRRALANLSHLELPLEDLFLLIVSHTHINVGNPKDLNCTSSTPSTEQEAQHHLKVAI